MDFNYSQFSKFRKNFEKFAKKIDQLNRTFLGQIAQECTIDIKRDTPVDTGNLRARWEVSPVGKKELIYYVTIFNPAEYASFVEDGHYTTGEGVKKRWVPGRWQGKKFIYDPNAKTGMLLKSKFIQGRHMAQINLTKWEFKMQERYDQMITKILRELGL